MRPNGSIYNNQPLMLAPGWNGVRRPTRYIVEVGRQLRDEDLPRYPLLPEAVKTAQELASSREWRIITTKLNARGAARAIEYINQTRSVNYLDTTIAKGLSEYMRRSYMDYVTIGRTLTYWDEGTPMEYLDPAYCHLYLNPKREWHYFNDQKYPEEQVWVHHPIPKGGYGYWESPLMPLIPTAMLAYLIREHDLASADGRKISDIMAVGSQAGGEALRNIVDEWLKGWDGSKPESNNLAILVLETLGQIPLKDMFFRLGIANIPEDFDRARFEFSYANEISAALGLALRHFWSKDEFTNRSLEEVNEQRQSVKGPNIFIRSVQEMVNSSGMLRQFGPNLHFEFVEEVDVATRKARADVLLSFATAVEKLLAMQNPAFTMETALAWGIRDGIVPSDLNILPEQIIQEGNALKSDELEIGEVSYDRHGFVVDYRPKSFHITQVIAKDYEAEIVHKIAEPDLDLFEKARKANADKFLELADASDELYVKVYNSYEKLTHDEHYEIYKFLYDTKDNSE